MNGETRQWLSAVRLIIIFAVLLLLFNLAALGLYRGPFPGYVFFVFTILALLVLLAGLSVFVGRHAGAAAMRQMPELPSPPPEEISDVFAPTSERRAGLAVVREGELKASAQAAADVLTERYKGTGWTPILTDSEAGRPALVLLPLELQSRLAHARVWVNWLLLGLTFVTTTWAGALHQGVNLLQEPGRFAVGLPYALGLMAILGAHEMGHYLTARRHGMRVTLPYFIPVPFALGTFGAFIRILSPARSRKGLFDMAAAGPYAGLVLAIPALLIGLPMSKVMNVPTTATPLVTGGVSLNSSILLALLAKLSLGHALTGNFLALHPLAFAGWLGLIVTALNLLPVGQLDGGHMADAMFGQRVASVVSMVAIFALVALGIFVWSGLLFWALIAYFIAGRKGLPPINDIDRLSPVRMAVGWLALVILLLILTPVPEALLQTLCARCPYL